MKIPARVLNYKTGKLTTKHISLEEVIPGRELTSKLTSEQIIRVKRLYSFLGYLLSDTLEDWIRDFTRDIFPEVEIKAWEEITYFFLKYTEQYTLSFHQKQDVLRRLTMLSFGEKPKDKLSKELFLFQEQLRKEIIEKKGRDTLLKTEVVDKRALLYVSPWDKVDFVQLNFVCQKYINQHEFSSEEEDDIYIRLIQLMAGDEPKDDLSRELLHALENEFDPQNIPDHRERVVSVVVQRKGQAKFRSDLLKAYQGKCGITGFSTKNVLQAAHIIPYLGYETNHPSNGILLRADIHILFDKHLLSIHPKSYEVVIAPSLFGTDYEGLGGKKLLLPEKDRFKPNSIALEQHYQAFLQKSEKKNLL